MAQSSMHVSRATIHQSKAEKNRSVSGSVQPTKETRLANFSLASLLMKPHRKRHVVKRQKYL
jgi:hypothetical protein